MDIAMKEVWMYEYGKTLTSIDAFEDEVLLSMKNRILHHFEVFENGILLLTRNKEAGSRRFFLESAVFLDRNGSEIWKYYYPWKNVPLINPYTPNFEIIEDRVFLSRERGFMDVFDVETGEKLWEIEVRGTLRVERSEEEPLESVNSAFMRMFEKKLTRRIRSRRITESKARTCDYNIKRFSYLRYLAPHLFESSKYLN